MKRGFHGEHETLGNRPRGTNRTQHPHQINVRGCLGTASFSKAVFRHELQRVGCGYYLEFVSRMWKTQQEVVRVRQIHKLSSPTCSMSMASICHPEMLELLLLYLVLCPSHVRNVMNTPTRLLTFSRMFSGHVLTTALLGVYRKLTYVSDFLSFILFITQPMIRIYASSSFAPRTVLFSRH